MNKAFVREPEQTADYCPRCGSAGDVVGAEALKSYLDHRGLAMDWDAVRAAPVNALVASLCMALPFDSTEKQALLEAPTPSDRREALITLLRFDAAGGLPGDASGLQ